MNQMNLAKSLAVLGLLTLLPGCATEKIPVGIGDESFDVRQVLDVYAKLTGKTVDTVGGVQNCHTLIRTKQTRPLTKAEAIQLIEQDLRDQAGIVVLSRDRHHVVFVFKAEAPPLDFLSDIPSLKTLSLFISESQFVSLLHKQRVPYTRSTEPDQTTTYALHPQTHVIVMVGFRDGHCSGIQRLPD